jgi:hypothetical protein
LPNLADLLTTKDWVTRCAARLTLDLPAHHRLPDAQGCVARAGSFATHAGTLTATIMNSNIRYKGYEVAPAAQRLPNGLFAANLTIEKTTTSPGQAYSFDALDYFFDEELALAYAFSWGRMWIDNRQ